MVNKIPKAVMPSVSLRVKRVVNNLAQVVLAIRLMS